MSMTTSPWLRSLMSSSRRWAGSVDRYDVAHAPRQGRDAGALDREGLEAVQVPVGEDLARRGQQPQREGLAGTAVPRRVPATLGDQVVGPGDPVHEALRLELVRVGPS